MRTVETPLDVQTVYSAMKYKVEITEFLQKTIELEASDEKEAILEVKHRYYAENIILDDTCYIDTNFDIRD